jgi:uncharacterized protein YegL
MKSSTVLIGGNPLEFSTSPIDKLTESRYTISRVMMDVTGSLKGFEPDILQALTKIVLALQESTYKYNILHGVSWFSSRFLQNIEEVHGTLPASDLDPAQLYKNVLCDGLTPLRDAFAAGIDMVLTEAEDRWENDFSVNGIVIVGTDGEENYSSNDVAKTKAILEKARRSEKLDSLITLLIGIDPVDCADKLREFRTEIGIDYYVEVGKMNDTKAIAKLIKVVSSSVVAQSQQIVTSGATRKSAILTF